ncbi:MAG: SDR family oxidoreductase, partial [Actinomycetota bacterium]|nr:SDR family oxidoreductase [Actinomycetota bacterium]
MTASWPVALVTGASSGIGETFARHLARDGSDLVLVARRRSRLETIADELRHEHAVAVEVLDADLTDPDGVERVARRLRDATPPVDLLVNNAGFGSHGPFADTDAAREADEVRLNVIAVQQLAHAALAGMRARRRGAILNVSSMAGFQPQPYAATYGATKAFVTSFSEALHAELAGSGVTVTALCPGFTRSDFAENAGVSESVVPAPLWLSADTVVDAGLRGLRRGRAVVVPGVGYQLTAAVSRVTPHAVTLPVVASVFRRR